MNQTDEQLDIINAATLTNDNLMISALAGTGKTTILRAVERAVKHQQILYLVFNNKNAREAEYLDEPAYDKYQGEKAETYAEDCARRMLSSTNVRTVNSIGHRIWAATQCKNLRVDGKKTLAIYKEIISDVEDQSTRDAMWEVYAGVLNGVAMAKALGYVPEGTFPHAKRLIDRGMFHASLDEIPDDLTADLIEAVLTRSIKAAYDGFIDYNDQIYMPALFSGTFPKYPLVLVDEYQDLSPVDHVLLERLVTGRIIGVGDPFQNIYGFRGASSSGMSEAVTRYNMTNFSLSVSFRCPSEIVKHVHWRVPQFRWLTEGGSVGKPSSLRAKDIPEEATIICRNNAPLFRCAMQLLAKGRSIAISGSDIGPRLVNIMRRLGPETLGQSGLFDSIEEWRADRLERESKTANDLADCMLVFASHGENLRQAIAYAEHLFKQSGRIQLTTGHKAKGLEWNNVIHLDPWLVRKGADDQDKNLDYVISTRSRDSLIEIDTEQLEW